MTYDYSCMLATNNVASVVLLLQGLVLSAQWIVSTTNNHYKAQLVKMLTVNYESCTGQRHVYYKQEYINFIAKAFQSTCRSACTHALALFPLIPKLKAALIKLFMLCNMFTSTSPKAGHLPSGHQK